MLFIKLHGSVNWFKVHNEWIANFHLGINSSLNFPDFNYVNLTAQLEELFSAEQIMEASPAIVPPMLGKESVSPVIANQWKCAIEAIRRARDIWVFGYSFPQTQISRALLTASIPR